MNKTDEEEQELHDNPFHEHRPPIDHTDLESESTQGNRKQKKVSRLKSFKRWVSKSFEPGRNSSTKTRKKSNIQKKETFQELQSTEHESELGINRRKGPPSSYYGAATGHLSLTSLANYHGFPSTLRFRQSEAADEMHHISTEIRETQKQFELYDTLKFTDKIHLPEEDDIINPVDLKRYYDEVRSSSLQTKKLLEWICSVDKSLKSAEKVCICYEQTTPGEPVILALYSSDIPSHLSPKLLKTFKIVHRCISTESEEAKFVSELEIQQKLNFSVAEHARVYQCLKEHTIRLMAEHSNLLVVSASMIKVQNHRTNNMTYQEQTCIVLYVQVKGLIPFGEKPFPSQLGDFPVDVREGCLRLFANPAVEFHKHLIMGCRIVTAYNTSGTLGAFVRLENGNIGCLTCCHIFETEESFSDYKDDPFSLNFIRKDVYQPAPSLEYKFGNVIKFINDPGGEYSIGVDAAVIEITNQERYPQTGAFPKTEDSIAGFSAEKPMLFNSGNIVKSFADLTLPCKVVKYGASTGLTVGSLSVCGSAIQLRSPSFNPNEKVQLHQQIEIISEEPPFADEGDSGSLVLCVISNGNDIQLKALGILVGGTNHHTAIVTPIWAVLSKLELPLQLLSFDDNNMDYQSDKTDNQRFRQIELDLESLKNELSSLNSRFGQNAGATNDKINTIENEIVRINSKLDGIISSVAQKEDIQTIIQMLQNQTSTK